MGRDRNRRAGLGPEGLHAQTTGRRAATGRCWRSSTWARDPLTFQHPCRHGPQELHRACFGQLQTPLGSSTQAKAGRFNLPPRGSLPEDRNRSRGWAGTGTWLLPLLLPLLPGLVTAGRQGPRGGCDKAEAQPWTLVGADTHCP